MLIVIGLAGCGRKGPPLPPFVRIPAAPAEMKAARRGDTVELQFTVPTANTDGTRPANVERVDVYGWAGPDLKDEDLFKHGPKVATVAVKAPRDPDATVEPDEPAADIDPLEGAGLDQGAVARVRQTLTAASLAPPEIAKKPEKKRPVVEDAIAQPLLGPPARVPSFTLVAVGISKNGHRGAMSPRVQVPLVPPPPPPSSPSLKYDETAVTVSWSAPPNLPQHSPAPADDRLPSRAIWFPPPAIGYHVYEVPPSAVAPTDGQAPKDTPVETRLTSTPVADTKYMDSRMTWGGERCYAVRSVETIAGQSVESDARPPACTKLVDTFPPAPPKGLLAVAGEGAISLIWQPNTEKDLAGYILLRGGSADTLQPIMGAPIQDATFKDNVPSGAHYVYAVKAVDKAGNTSPASTPSEATARE